MSIPILPDPKSIDWTSYEACPHPPPDGGPRRPSVVGVSVQPPTEKAEDVSVRIVFSKRFTFRTWWVDGAVRVESVTVTPFEQAPQEFLPHDLPMPPHAFGEYWPAGTIMELVFTYDGPAYPFRVAVEGFKD